MTRFELLAPAGDLDKLKVALLYGADAVFIGGKKFSLRAKANNFTLEEIKMGVEFAHNLGKKVHVTVNIIPNEKELEEAKKYIKELVKIKVDAIIVSSVALMEYVKNNNLPIDVHVSTQCSVSNSSAIKFYKEEFNIKRIVLARECSIKNIECMKKEIDTEIEIFIHGGLCSSISGRCHLSDFYTQRKANKGCCAHSCRWTYKIDDDKKFLFGCKDLCSISFFSKLLDLGINSFKIEGRMKSIHYIASVVRAYRYYIDAYEKNMLNEEVINFCNKELLRCESRDYGKSFFLGKIDKSDMVEYEKKEVNNEFVGYIRVIDDKIFLIPKTLIFKNDCFEMIVPNKIDSQIIKIEKMVLNEEEVFDTRHVNDKIEIFVDKNVCDYAILRKIK